MTPEQYAERRADVEVVRRRSSFGGIVSTRADSFVKDIYKRDAMSFFRVSIPLVSQALHIVAHARGTPVCECLHLGINLAHSL